MTKLEKRFVWIVSIAIPAAVAILFKVRIEGFDLSFLPPFYASINALTTVVLLLAFLAIRKKNVRQHRMWIRTAMLLSIVFLLSYVLYHMTSEPTPHGGEGWVKGLYYFVLISHILLSLAVIPLVLVAYLHGRANRILQHRKMVKWAFPVWLYVAITGVVVYLMIAPYYA